jgi:excisionase family DNA binding protein
MAVVSPTGRPSPILIPVADIGPLLGGLSRSVVYRYLAGGSLRSLQIGRRRFVRRSDLEAFVEQFAVLSQKTADASAERAPTEKKSRRARPHSAD